jgi:hypothetical protein
MLPVLILCHPKHAKSGLICVLSNMYWCLYHLPITVSHFQLLYFKQGSNSTLQMLISVFDKSWSGFFPVASCSEDNWTKYYGQSLSWKWQGLGNIYSDEIFLLWTMNVFQYYKVEAKETNNSKTGLFNLKTVAIFYI